MAWRRKLRIIPDGWLEIGLLGVQKASFGVLQLALNRYSTYDCCSVFEGSQLFAEVFRETGALDESNWCTTQCFDDTCCGSSYRPGVMVRAL